MASVAAAIVASVMIGPPVGTRPLLGRLLTPEHIHDHRLHFETSPD
jgi:hypothetical protein